MRRLAFDHSQLADLELQLPYRLYAYRTDPHKSIQAQGVEHPWVSDFYDL